MALGPFFESRETRFTNGMTVARLVLFQKTVADQQFDATPADLDRRNHDNAPGAALAEASCTDGGWRFVDHVTGCYYDINGDFVAISVGTFFFVGLQAIAALLTHRDHPGAFSGDARAQRRERIRGLSAAMSLRVLRGRADRLRLPAG